MATVLGQGSQIISYNYKEDLNSFLLNKTFYKLFSPGILSLSFSYTNSSITIANISFFITPNNKTDIIVKVDTTDNIIITGVNSSTPYIVARLQWQNDDTNAVEFLNVATPQEYDVIITKLEFDGSGNIIDYNNNEQTKSNVATFFQGMSIDNAKYLDCHEAGNDSNNIPINNNILNHDLVAEMINGKYLGDFAINDNTLQVGLNSDMVHSYNYTDLVLTNGTFQLNVNADKLNGHDIDYFAQCVNADQNNCDHLSSNIHNLDSGITDGNTYKRIKSLNGSRQITTDSIANESITNAIENFAINAVGTTFKPKVFAGIYSNFSGSASTRVVTITLPEAYSDSNYYAFATIVDNQHVFVATKVEIIDSQKFKIYVGPRSNNNSAPNLDAGINCQGDHRSPICFDNWTQGHPIIHWVTIGTLV